MEPIEVPLRLDLAGLAQDIRQAEQMLAGVGPRGGGGTASGGNAFNRLNPQLLGVPTASTAATAVAAKTLTKNAVATEEKAKKAAAKALNDKASFMRDMSFLMMPLLNPMSPWGMLFGTRQVFSAMTKTDVGRRMSGGTIGGAAMMTGAVMAGATALGVALKGLTEAVKGTIDAFKRAGGEYARALRSGGLPLGFTVRRTALAQVLGVGENEVFQFGRQIMYLNDRLAWANNVIAQTTPRLTQVNFEFKVMEANLKAVFAKLALEAAPALFAVAEGINVIIKASERMIKAAIMIRQAAIDSLRFSIVGQVIKMMDRGAGGAFKFLSEKGNALMDKSNFPPPQSYMKQLPVSAWERMGLIVGQFGAARNPAEQTAKNTKELVHEVKGLRQSMIPRSGMEFWNPAIAAP